MFEKCVHVNCVQGIKKSWMDRNVFTDWYKNVFIPSVKKRNPDPEAKEKKQFSTGVALSARAEGEG
ncbi:hypothetical protein NQ318_008044 [Aromia moschata]|uniref:Uncharacterized protein n=1 Tax=Aromia moschata TaxID=1265417 RepID=A0AAV8XY13_9CUCU|nr:hypothetical protein NQ318_008044 [Aromia moschata]